MEEIEFNYKRRVKPSRIGRPRMIIRIRKLITAPIILSVTALLLCVVSSACSSINDTTPRKLADGIIIQVIFFGGMKPPGQYEETNKNDSKNGMLFEANGYTQYKNDDGIQSFGNLTSDELTDLKKIMTVTNFNLIRSYPPRAPCPTTNDGVETVFIFFYGDGEEKLSVCKYDINTKSPLFELINNLSKKYHSSYLIEP